MDDEFTKQLMGSSVANGIFLILFVLIKCCRDKVKHSHCKSGCCEIDTDMKSTRRDNDFSVSISENARKKRKRQRSFSENSEEIEAQIV